MKKVIVSFLFMILLLISYSFIEPNIITIKEYEIENEALTGLEIVFLSDFHHSEINSIQKIKRIVKKTNQLNPDLIILVEIISVHMKITT